MSISNHNSRNNVTELRPGISKRSHVDIESGPATPLTKKELAGAAGAVAGAVALALTVNALRSSLTEVPDVNNITKNTEEPITTSQNPDTGPYPTDTIGFTSEANGATIEGQLDPLD